MNVQFGMFDGPGFNPHGAYVPIQVAEPHAPHVADLKVLEELYVHDMACRRKQEWELTRFDSSHEELVLLEMAENQTAHAILNPILSTYPRKVFLGGGALVNMCQAVKFHATPHHPVNLGTNLRIKDYDLFIVADTEAEATAIVNNCVSAILSATKTLPEAEVIGTRNENCLTVIFNAKGFKIGENNIYNLEENLIHTSVKFQFIFRKYTHRSQIPGMFDIGPSQIIYSKGYGLEATRMGHYCHENQCQFLDPTRRSPNFASRVFKYEKRGFNLCIPNLIPGGPVWGKVDWESAWRRNLSQYCIEGPSIDDSRRRHYTSSWQNKPQYQDEDYSEEMAELSSLFKYLYFTVPLNEFSPILVDLTAKEYPADIKTALALQNYTGKILYPLRMDYLTVPALKNLMGDEFDFKYFMNNNMDTDDNFHAWGKKMSLNRQDELLHHLKPFGDKGTFITANPGRQGGGSFRPTTMTGSEFWKPIVCSPIIVGIP